MSNTTITVDGVNLPLLNTQRRELHDLLQLFEPDSKVTVNLWGLLEMLDYICEQYETEAYAECAHDWLEFPEVPDTICELCGVRPD